MSKTVFRFLLPLTLWIGAAVLAQPLVAQEMVLDLDPADTQVNFSLGDVLHTVFGTFHLKKGAITFDPSTGDAKGEVIVDASSGDSGSKSRDKKMNKDILETQKYPEITFVPKHVVGQVSLQGESQVQVQGVFTLHGTPHELTLDAHLQAAPDKLTATIKFPVPYVKWGLKNPSNFILRVSDKVEIDLKATGHLSKGPAAQ